MKWKKEHTTALEDKYDSLKALADNFPDDVNNWEQLADCCNDLNRLDEAEGIYKNLILQYPDKCKYYYRLGKVLSNKQLYDSALLEQEKAIELWDGFIWAKLEKAKCLNELKRKDDAKKVLIDILSLRKYKDEDKIAFINIYKLLSKIYIEEKDIDKALECLNHLVKIQPDDGIHHYNIGKIYLDKKNYETALQNFRESNKYLNESWVLDKIAVCMVYLEMLDDALKIYESIPFHKKQDYIHQHCGRLFLKIGKFEEAKKELKRSLNKPGQSKFNSHFYLAKVYEELKLFKNAIKEYEQAIKCRKSEFGKDFPDAIEKIKYINKNIEINQNENIEDYEDLINGNIIRYFNEKGFGFIKADDGNEYFFHIKNCKYKDPKLKDGVRFEIVEGKKGKDAINVRKV